MELVFQGDGRNLRSEVNTGYCKHSRQFDPAVVCVFGVADFSGRCRSYSFFEKRFGKK